jgi:hypothetical protein
MSKCRLSPTQHAQAENRDLATILLPHDFWPVLALAVSIAVSAKCDFCRLATQTSDDLCNGHASVSEENQIFKSCDVVLSLPAKCASGAGGRRFYDLSASDLTD